MQRWIANWGGIVLGLIGAVLAIVSLRMERPPADPADAKPALYAHLGGVTTLVDFDLTGEWELMHYGTQEKPADKDKSAWTGKFTLERIKLADALLWGGKDAYGTWELTKNAGGQHLIWNHTWRQNVLIPFSINEHAFGVLHLTDEHGEKYLFIRREGGQSSPPLTAKDYDLKPRAERSVLINNSGGQPIPGG